MKITLAIPNYNGLENLKVLLPQVLKEGFDQIYVLDDKSTDQSVAHLRENFSQVQVIQGKENLGAAGNCNRILAQSYGDLIIFLDADMRLMTGDLPQIINSLFRDPQKTLIGGQIITQKGKPMIWNYGHEMHPLKDLMGVLVEQLASVFKNKELVLNFLIKYFSKFTHNLKIKYREAEQLEVDWVSEACFCVRAEAFKEIGGYDPKMRYHAAQDLCKRLRKKGYQVFFSPEIKVKHMTIDTFGKRRLFQNIKHSLYFYKKHYF